MANTVTYDTRLTVARAAEQLLLRCHTADNEFRSEFVIGRRAMYRTPLLATVGTPEPGLPMRNVRIPRSDALDMFGALVKAVRSGEQIAFAGDKLTGSYELVKRFRGRLIVTELLGSGLQMAVNRIRVDHLDFHLLERALEEINSDEDRVGA